MRPHIFIVFTSLLTFATAASASDNGKSASSIGNYKSGGTVVRQTSAKDCSQVIIQYKDSTQTKTLCSAPWTGPSGSPESGSGTSASATSTQS